VNSPEAFEEVFWKTYDSRCEQLEVNFKHFINLICHKYGKSRYLSKNNQNIKRPELLRDIYPDAKILIPFRDPIQQAFSLVSQHKRFLEMSKSDAFVSHYMKWIGHTEFGRHYKPIMNHKNDFSDHLKINHWLEQWVLLYGWLCKKLSNKINIKFVCYERLCSSDVYWTEILNFLEIKKNIEFQFKSSIKSDVGLVDRDLVTAALSIYNELINE
jgi:hypothetical protein